MTKILLSILLLCASTAWADVAVCDGTTCANKLGVDSNGNAKVKGPDTASQAGFGGVTGISGGGATASSKRFNPIYGSEGGGLRQAIPHLLWDDTFNATAQNTSKYRFANTTMTADQTGGYLRLNAGSSVATNVNVALQTFKVFPLFAKAETRVTISAMHTTAPQSNATTEWGLMTATIPGAAAPTDGCFFRFNSSAEFRGVCSYNGTEVQTAAITATSANVNHDYTIVVQTNTVLFYVDDSAVGTLTLLSDAPSQGQPIMQATVPVTFRHINGGSAPSLAMQFKVSDVFVMSLGPDLGRSWADQKAGFGHMGYQGQNGGTMGTTANYANSANPTAAVPTNTTAALGTGLGGQFWETVTLAANSDGIIQSFQNPVGGVNQTPRNLIIRGVTYHCYNQVALATVAFNKQQSLAFGHTTVSLATAEGTSFTTSPTTKAPRRIALGVIQPIAAVNTAYPVYTVTFQSPIVIAPGEFVALVSKNVGTVPATGVIAWMILYDAYFE
jgi:hypothetical protein